MCFLNSRKFDVLSIFLLLVHHVTKQNICKCFECAEKTILEIGLSMFELVVVVVVELVFEIDRVDLND
jgi:hypothetical protein